MTILFWGPVTLKWFHFDVKHAKPTKKTFFSIARMRPGAASKKRISTYEGSKKIFSNPLMMGIKKRRILCRFQKYKLVLVEKCP
jgi:hypothetical protein